MAKITNITCTEDEDCIKTGEFLLIFLTPPLIMILFVCWLSRRDRPNLAG